ncbi:MAG: hypothetical protein LUO93_03265 [Methanomicrobiales archaeon]|nr:hypothetical protein [Methanomicrobiales archaeon]
MNSVAIELDEFSIDTSSLYEISRRLDILTEEVRKAQTHDNIVVIPGLLKNAVEVMKEASVILKMTLVVERGRLPPELMDHLARIRLHNDRTMEETMTLLHTFSTAD